MPRWSDSRTATPLSEYLRKLPGLRPENIRRSSSPKHNRKRTEAGIYACFPSFSFIFHSNAEPVCRCSRSKFLSKILKILVKNFPEIFPEFFFYSFANFNEKNSNLASLNDSGAIKGMDAREDGVYITYTPTAGADTVTKKLGSDTLFPKILLQPNAGHGTFDTFMLDVSEKSILSIETMQSWYDNAGVSIIADETVNLYSKSHQTGGANRIDTSAIGKFDVSAYSTITITFSAAAINPDARGWATLNNISIS